LRISGDNVLTGAIVENQYTGAATEQKHNPERLNISNIPGLSAVYVRWIMDGKGPFTISVDAPKGGTDSIQIK